MTTWTGTGDKESAGEIELTRAFDAALIAASAATATPVQSRIPLAQDHLPVRIAVEYVRQPGRVGRIRVPDEFARLVEGLSQRLRLAGELARPHSRS